MVTSKPQVKSENKGRRRKEERKAKTGLVRKEGCKGEGETKGWRKEGIRSSSHITSGIIEMGK